MGECVREHEMREANTGPFEGKTIARLTIYEYLFQKGLAFLLADPSGTYRMKPCYILPGMLYP